MFNDNKNLIKNKLRHLRKNENSLDKDKEFSLLFHYKFLIPNNILHTFN